MLPELTQPDQALRAVFDRFRRDAGLIQLPPPPPPPPPPAPPEPAEPCRCGCLALRVRNAHLEDQVHRLVAVLGESGGALEDDDADRRRAADRNWPAWLAGQDLGPGPATP